MSPLLTMALILCADCLDGQCKPSPSSPKIEWRSRPDDPDRAYLFVDGVQAGGYDRARDEWRPFVADAWGAPTALFPSSLAKADESILNFGVVREPLPSDRSRHTLNGKVVTEQEAASAIAGNALTDDSLRLRLTIIGADADRQRVLDDLRSSPELDGWSHQMLVQAYPPDHWAIAGNGFVTTGTPTIYVQAADGKVLHRQDSYRGPKQLAEALRRADPNYRPDKDPDLNLVFPIHLDWRRIPTWLWVVAVLLLISLLRRRNRT